MLSVYSEEEKAMQIINFPRDVANRMRDDRLTRHAAGLSISSLVALAPLKAIALTMI